MTEKNDETMKVLKSIEATMEKIDRTLGRMAAHTMSIGDDIRTIRSRATGIYAQMFSLWLLILIIMISVM